MNDIKVFGAPWCHDTRNTIAQLDAIGVPYQFINIDDDPAAKEWVKQQNGGKQKIPTLDIQGQILVIPDEDELGQALRTTGLLA